MTQGRLLMLVAWTFACPGVGHGAAGRRVAMFAWAIAGLVSLVAFTWTVWALHVALAVRLASAIDVLLRLRRQDPGEDLNLPLIASAIGVAGFLHFQFLTDRFHIPASSMYPTIEIGDHVFVDKLTLYWDPPRRGEVIVFRQPCAPQTSYIKRVVGVAGDTVEVRCHKLYVNGKPTETGLVERVCEYLDAASDGSLIPKACSRYRETLGGHTYDTFHGAHRPDQDQAGAGDAKDFPSLDGVVRSCASTTEWSGGEGAGTSRQPIGAIVATGPGAGPCDPQLHFVVPPDSVFTLGDHRANSNDSRYWGVVPLDHVTGRAIGIVWPLRRTGSIE